MADSQQLFQLGGLLGEFGNLGLKTAFTMSELDENREEAAWRGYSRGKQMERDRLDTIKSDQRHAIRGQLLQLSADGRKNMLPGGNPIEGQMNYEALWTSLNNPSTGGMVREIVQEDPEVAFAINQYMGWASGAVPNGVDGKPLTQPGGRPFVNHEAVRLNKGSFSVELLDQANKMAASVPQYVEITGTDGKKQVVDQRAKLYEQLGLPLEVVHYDTVTGKATATPQEFSELARGAKYNIDHGWVKNDPRGFTAVSLMNQADPLGLSGPASEKLIAAAAAGDPAARIQLLQTSADQNATAKLINATPNELLAARQGKTLEANVRAGGVVQTKAGDSTINWNVGSTPASNDPKELSRWAMNRDSVDRLSTAFAEDPKLYNSLSPLLGRSMTGMRTEKGEIIPGTSSIGINADDPTVRDAALLTTGVEVGGNLIRADWNQLAKQKLGDEAYTQAQGVMAEIANGIQKDKETPAEAVLANKLATLGDTIPLAPEIIANNPELGQALVSNDPKVREVAMMRLINDSKAGVHARAKEVTGRIGADAKTVSGQTIIPGLMSPNADERLAAMQVVQSTSINGRPMLDVMKEYAYEVKEGRYPEMVGAFRPDDSVWPGLANTLNVLNWPEQLLMAYEKALSIQTKATRKAEQARIAEQTSSAPGTTRYPGIYGM